MKKPKKPQSAENADTAVRRKRRKDSSPAVARARSRRPKNIPDETIAATIIATGGRQGKAAQAFGIVSRSPRDRLSQPSLKGLSERAKAEVRALLKRNVIQMLEEKNERVTIEMMKTKFGRELDFAPDAQKVELSGKVDGDLRLGVLDERAAAARLKALEEAK